jgi:molecular chaperone DnaK (HSP70)
MVVAIAKTARCPLASRSYRRCALSRAYAAISTRIVLTSIFIGNRKTSPIFVIMSTTSSTPGTGTSSAAKVAVAVGMDLGSYNARVATYDENLKHPVRAHNSDGHRTTRVVLEGHDSVTASNLECFIQERLVQLAVDAAHTKDLSIVTSIPNEEHHSALQDEWLQVLQKVGGVMTEAAAVCLAYDLEEEANNNRRTLVVDGGASGLKVAILRGTNGLWCLEATKMLPSVCGSALVEPLAQSVAQQFEIKHRFPQGEVWSSKKARAKLQRACESGLTTLQINNTVTIHVDGLYEGIDASVTISKAKWDHLSSKLVKDAKDFLHGLPHEVDTVLLSGNMHAWLKPIVENVFPGKLLSSPSVDPSEAVALGCTKQARWMLSHPQQQQQSSLGVLPTTTIEVPMSPVSIAINQDTIVIDKGAPLPAVVNYELSAENTSAAVEIWQMTPTQKQLASLSGLSHPSTIRILLTQKGSLRIAVGGESIVIG